MPASKWARDDDDSDDEQKKSARGLGLSYSSSGSENAGDGLGKADDEMEFATYASIPMQTDSGMNEEQRQKLRSLEVALIEYRESLEERGIKSAEEIERKVAIHRKRLQSEYGLLDSPQDIPGNSKRTSERRDRRDDGHESSRKRHRSQSRSQSPQRKTSTRERENDSERDRERHRDRDRAHDMESDRREKSGSRERDDHDRDRGRERDRDRDRRRRAK